MSKKKSKVDKLRTCRLKILYTRKLRILKVKKKKQKKTIVMGAGDSEVKGTTRERTEARPLMYKYCGRNEYIRPRPQYSTSARFD